MKLARFPQLCLLISSTIFGLLASNTIGSAQAQSVVKMRFVWDFVPSSGGAAYLNICDDPKFNIDENTGGCASINVLNSNVTTNRSRTRLVTDRLKSGQEYKVCVVADNTFSNRKGRWIDCIDFVARDGQTINLSLASNRARYVGQP